VKLSSGGSSSQLENSQASLAIVVLEINAKSSFIPIEQKIPSTQLAVRHLLRSALAAPRRIFKETRIDINISSAGL
jgi:hypothetical protein